jgi:hypothetical protein
MGDDETEGQLPPVDDEGQEETTGETDTTAEDGGDAAEDGGDAKPEPDSIYGGGIEPKSIYGGG